MKPISTSTDMVVDKAVNYGKDFERRKEAFKARMSPAGALGLPPLLDERRLMYAIPDSCFTTQAAYDRILVKQIPARTDDKAGEGSLIVLTDNRQKINDQSCPRGIIINAGLKALDVLRSNGMDVGHIVGFIQHSIFSRPCETIDGYEVRLQILRDGDILDSEDTKRALDAGVVEIRYDDKENQHYYFDKTTGKRWDPQSPWLSDEL